MSVEIQWIHDTIRSRQVVRVDLVRWNDSGYKSMHAEIIAGREDEEGLDPVYFAYETNVHDAIQTHDVHLAWRGLLGWNEKRLHAFLAAARSGWHPEWRVEQEVFVRSRPWSFNTEDTTWRIEPPGSELRLKALLNLQGVITFHVSQVTADNSDARFAGSWCLIGLINRMRGLANEEFAALRESAKGQ